METKNFGSSQAQKLNDRGLELYVAEDFDAAFKLFQEAADGGCVYAMLNLADCYLNGKGVAQDLQKSLEWNERAANLGNSQAMLSLAAIYYLGDYGIAQDYERAFSWCLKAAELGEVIAMRRLGDIYILGTGVEKNFEEGMKWLKKAAELGDVESMLFLARIFETNEEPEIQKMAIEYYLEAVRRENPIAMNNLGYMLQHGIPGVVEADLEKAKILFESAAERGNDWAMVNLAELLKEMGDNDGYEYWYIKATAAGNEKARDVVNSWQDGGCFITTAICESFGKPDDCYELTVFRNFRDSWLAKEADGAALIDEYYFIAPKIVAEINRRSDSEKIYRGIWEEYLKPCLQYIQRGEFARCKEKYIEMVRHLQNLYLKKLDG